METKTPSNTLYELLEKYRSTFEGHVIRNDSINIGPIGFDYDWGPYREPKSNSEDAKMQSPDLSRIPPQGYEDNDYLKAAADGYYDLSAVIGNALPNRWRDTAILMLTAAGSRRAAMDILFYTDQKVGQKGVATINSNLPTTPDEDEFHRDILEFAKSIFDLDRCDQETRDLKKLLFGTYVAGIIIESCFKKSRYNDQSDEVVWVKELINRQLESTADDYQVYPYESPLLKNLLMVIALGFKPKMNFFRIINIFSENQPSENQPLDPSFSPDDFLDSGPLKINNRSSFLEALVLISHLGNKNRFLMAPLGEFSLLQRYCQSVIASDNQMSFLYRKIIGDLRRIEINPAEMVNLFGHNGRPVKWFRALFTQKPRKKAYEERIALQRYAPSIEIVYGLRDDMSSRLRSIPRIDYFSQLAKKFPTPKFKPDEISFITGSPGKIAQLKSLGFVRFNSPIEDIEGTRINVHERYSNRWVPCVMDDLSDDLLKSKASGSFRDGSIAVTNTRAFLLWDSYMWAVDSSQSSATRYYRIETGLEKRLPIIVSMDYMFFLRQLERVTATVQLCYVREQSRIMRDALKAHKRGVTKLPMFINLANYMPDAAFVAVSSNTLEKSKRFYTVDQDLLKLLNRGVSGVSPEILWMMGINVPTPLSSQPFSHHPDRS